MPEGYDTHADYMDWVRDESARRQSEVLGMLRRAFTQFIHTRQVEVIEFGGMTVHDLAAAITDEPGILKPLMACCNIAGRAVERDLDIRGIDSYRPRLSVVQAAAIAGYLKPFLPAELAIPALSEIDRHFYVDKEIRARKGRWEKVILRSLNTVSCVEFKKRRFEVDGESFEIDAASPVDGPIDVAIDMKRIEARRDIHKRADEILNKAAKFKRRFPEGRFAAVVYYPFTSEHLNVQSRLLSPSISAICFASSGHERIQTAIGLLVDRLGLRRAR
ncbi:MAG: hypothetical protein HRU70_04460 [Phycisphaeraceae bacterium]|nr:MAG: hypothetical protein HRU70_04460 [Phycisphaeraceae bacterium]